MIAYTPLDKGRVTNGKNNKEKLVEIAKKYNKTPSQVALNWLTTRSKIICIPKSNNPHILNKMLLQQIL